MPQLAPLPAPRSPSSSNCPTFASLPTASAPLSPSQPHPSLVWPELSASAAPPFAALPFAAPPVVAAPVVATPGVAPRAIGLAVQRLLASQAPAPGVAARFARGSGPSAISSARRSLSSAASDDMPPFRGGAVGAGSEGGALAADDYDSDSDGVMTDARATRAPPPTPEPPTSGGAYTRSSPRTPMTPVRAVADAARQPHRPERSPTSPLSPGGGARARKGRSPELNLRLLGEKAEGGACSPTWSPPPPPRPRRRSRACVVCRMEAMSVALARGGATGCANCAPEKARGGAGLAASGLCPLCSADVMCAHEREWADW